MKKTCLYPGCPALLDRGTYCDTHKASAPKRHQLYNRHVRQRDPALATAYKIRCSARWKKIRRQVLADNPVCADPFGDHSLAGITHTSTQVHHIQGIAEHPELWNVQTNLQALCTKCHARLEREHRKNAASDPEPSSLKTDSTQDTGGGQKNFCPFG